MKWAAKLALALAAACIVLSLFLVPVVGTTTRPSDEHFAFLGPFPASESVSCAVFGMGSGSWETATSANPGAFYSSYHLGCPPRSVSYDVTTTTATTVT
jgi:hypothetical protein